MEEAKCELLGYHSEGLNGLYLFMPAVADDHNFAAVYEKEIREQLAVTSECRILSGKCRDELRAKIFNKSKKRK